MKEDSALYRLRRKIQYIAFHLFSHEILSKFYFRLLMKSKLNLKEPTGFNEKIQWLKLYEFPFNDLVIKCADKYEVREYIKEKGLSSILNELYFACDDVSNIDWDLLPNQFALKCTHGCGYNIICHNKSELNINKTKKQLTRWMKQRFGNYNVELHYNKMKPRIICEKYLGKNILDYKFYCFNGVPKFMYMSSGLGDYNDAKISFYNIDKSDASFGRSDFKKLEKIQFPDNYEQMVDIAKILSKDFLFVRVDLYEFEGKVYFGELTFTPAGGLMKIEPESYEKLFGSYINLKPLMDKKNKK